MMTTAEMRRLEKESKNPSTNDSTHLPEGFSWANSSLTKCPIGTIRDQSNCGCCWVILFMENDKSISIIQDFNTSFIFEILDLIAYK